MVTLIQYMTHLFASCSIHLPLSPKFHVTIGCGCIVQPKRHSSERKGPIWTSESGFLLIFWCNRNLIIPRIPIKKIIPPFSGKSIQHLIHEGHRKMHFTFLWKVHLVRLDDTWTLILLLSFLLWFSYKALSLPNFLHVFGGHLHLSGFISVKWFPEHRLRVHGAVRQESYEIVEQGSCFHEDVKEWFLCEGYSDWNSTKLVTSPHSKTPANVEASEDPSDTWTLTVSSLKTQYSDM
uniref:Uncharacterized protein n=1 Tax=Solanum lycopersicum TaxID=4081 RepID=A0A3Q7IFP3_SOLLC